MIKKAAEELAQMNQGPGQGQSDDTGDQADADRPSASGLVPYTEEDEHKVFMLVYASGLVVSFETDGLHLELTTLLCI